MVRLQALTGMRPGEVTIMRGCDLGTTGTVWTYTPSTQRTEDHGMERPIDLGPEAQDVIKPFLMADLSALFDPREMMKKFQAMRRNNRKALQYDNGLRDRTFLWGRAPLRQNELFPAAVDPSGVEGPRS